MFGIIFTEIERDAVIPIASDLFKSADGKIIGRGKPIVDVQELPCAFREFMGEDTSICSNDFLKHRMSVLSLMG